MNAWKYTSTSPYTFMEGIKRPLLYNVAVFMEAENNVLVLRFLMQWVETNKSERSTAFLPNVEADFYS
jgi:hypothetical protein